MSKGADTNATTTTSSSWSTWEELLLAFAVKRHGLKDWGTVAMELQNRHHRTSSTLFTSQICKDRYCYLRQRFTNHRNSDAEDNNEIDDAESATSSLPWLEELRKLRVAELKREVQRYDLSIESLQMKAKTMEEEERENTSSENQNGVVKQPDLDEEQEQEERSENDKPAAGEEAVGKSVSAEDDDENRSFNESNSNYKTEPGPVMVKPEKSESPKPPPVFGGEEDSCNDSSDRHEVRKKARKCEIDADELRDSVSDSKEGTTKETSDVQSSASLMTMKRRRKGELDNGGLGGEGGGGDGGAVVSPPNVSIKLSAVNFEPLIGFLEIIRSNKHASVFKHRLESQKTDKYKNMIRQHVDLETVQVRIDNGSYSSCSRRFYVDLLLLFNNAIVFYPKSSPESLAAFELRQVVMKFLRKNSVAEPSPESLPTRRVQPTPDSLLKSTVPIIVCRNRSSIQASVNKVEKQGEYKSVTNSKSPPINTSPLTTSNEEDSSMTLKAKEKPVTRVRSMRRSNKGRSNPSSSSQQAGTIDNNNNKGQAAAKVVKKKTEEVAATIKMSGATDFLKRIIKKNDPSKETTLVEARKSSGENLKGGNKNDQPAKKPNEGKLHAKEEISPSKRNVGRPPKKGKEAAVAAPMGKRRRESSEGEGSSKQSKKRSRR